MGGRRRLRSGLPRLYTDHREWEAVAHRRLFAAIEADLGPFSPLARHEAWRVASLGVEAEAALRALTDARRARRLGSGKRRVPSPKTVERLARRAGLANESYSRGLEQVRELTRHRKPLTLAERLSHEAGGLP